MEKAKATNIELFTKIQYYIVRIYNKASTCVSKSEFRRLESAISFIKSELEFDYKYGYEYSYKISVEERKL